MLKAAINGARSPEEHASIPITTQEISADACAVVKAGADALHFHVRDAQGQESLGSPWVAEQLIAVRSAVPNTPVGISTGEWIVPNLAQRLDFIRQWEVLPDFVSVNFDEAGATQVAELILSKNIGLEAGLCNLSAVNILLQSGLANHCLRLLLEPSETTTEEAAANAQAMVTALDKVAVVASRFLHGSNATAWNMLRMAKHLRYDTRIGFEDTLMLPNGEPATNNASLVMAARNLLL